MEDDRAADRDRAEDQVVDDADRSDEQIEHDDDRSHDSDNREVGGQLLLRGRQGHRDEDGGAGESNGDDNEQAQHEKPPLFGTLVFYYRRKNMSTLLVFCGQMSHPFNIKPPLGGYGKSYLPSIYSLFHLGWAREQFRAKLSILVSPVDGLQQKLPLSADKNR